MADPERSEAPPPRPGVRDYRLLGGAALLFVTVVLVHEDLGWFAIVPLGAGGLGLLVPGTVSPPLVLFLLGVLLVMRNWMLGFPWFHRPSSAPLVEILLAVSVLVYVMAHARLLTLLRHAVPPDARRQRRPRVDRLDGRWLLPRKPTRRTADEVAPGEFLVLGLAALGFAVVSYLLWVRVALEREPDWFELPLPWWRAILVTWALTLALVGTSVFLAYLRRATASREESLLYLQDQLWDVTRGEQRRIHSWLTWLRLRRQPRDPREQRPSS